MSEPPSESPHSPPFLEQLSPETRRELQVRSRRIRYPAATVAFHQGDPMQIAILLSGFARVFISSLDGRQATVRYVQPGELMGAPIVANEPFPGSVQLVTESALQYLDIDTFKALLHTRGDMSLAVAGDLAARYIHAVRSATVLIFGTTTQKIAHDLLERACMTQLATGRLICKVSQQELADSVNSSREVVSRSIAVLRKQGIVTTGVRVTTVVDPARLESVARRGLIDVGVT